MWAYHVPPKLIEFATVLLRVMGVLQMRNVDELRLGRASGGGSSGLVPSVAAPKIKLFCEQHLALVGRLVANRLLLELSPFMDSSVAGTSAAPSASTRGELVATRRRLDEVGHAFNDKSCVPTCHLKSTATSVLLN